MRGALHSTRVLWLNAPPSPHAAIDVLPALDLTTHAASSLHADSMALADHLALIMFTSGSTSTPKPVPFTHCQLLWSLEHSQQQRLRFPEVLKQPNAGTLSFLPNFHVIGFINNFLSKCAQPVFCCTRAFGTILNACTSGFASL